MLNTTDAQGRLISFKEMNPTDMLDLLEAAGPLSTNPGWMKMAMVIASVTDIAGTPVPTARTKDQIRNIARQLGNDGLVALNAAIFGADDEVAEKEAADTAKN
jgi:hypothetical protein